MRTVDVNSWFEVVTHFDDTHRIRLNRSALEFYNILTKSAVRREDLRVNAVALKADNGVLYAGNVSFLSPPEVGLLRAEGLKSPEIRMMGPVGNWKTTINGMGPSGVHRYIEHTLTTTIIELHMVKGTFFVRSCPFL